MKKIIVMFVSLLIISACSDDDNARQKSEVRLEYDFYTLDNAIFDGFDAETTNFDITDSPENEHVLRLTFAQIDAMPDGTYTLHAPFEDDYDPNVHFAGGALYPAFGEPQILFLSGTVTFSRSGSGYKIVFDIETTEGSLEGTYIGPISQQ